MVAPLETLSRTHAIQPITRPPITARPAFGTRPVAGQMTGGVIDPHIANQMGAGQPVVDFPAPQTRPPEFSIMPVLPPTDEPPPQVLPKRGLMGSFGLSGAESAIRGGALSGAQAIQEGVQGGLGTLLAGFGQGSDFINRGIASLGGGGGAGAQQATAAQAAGVTFDPRTGQAQFQQGAQGIEGFRGAGLDAQQVQAAMSGALGPEAQRQAFADFIESPEQAFIREMGEQAVLRNAAATGNTASGRVLTELQRQGQGLAAQDIQNRFGRLQALSGQGLQAATAAGQLRGQAGQLEAGMSRDLAQLQQQRNLQNAQMATQAALQNAQLGTQAGIASMQNQADMARARAGLFGQGADLAARMAGQGAQMQFGGGQNLSSIFGSAGSQIGGLRFGAGQDIQRAIAANAAGLSNLQQQQGAGISDLIGQSGANLANLISAAGQSGDLAALGQLLSNQAIGQGSNIANLISDIGRAEAGGILGRGQAQAGLASNLIGLTGILAGMGGE